MAWNTQEKEVIGWRVIRYYLGCFVQLGEVGNGIDPVVGRKEPPFQTRKMFFGWKNLN
jgi:hypothetical protein